MDLQTVLNEIDSWTVEERLRLLHEVWERLPQEGPPVELSDSLKGEIERRLAAYESNPKSAVPWEQVRAEALARFRK